MEFENRWFLCKTCCQYIRTPERFLGHKKKECKRLKLNLRTCSTPIARYHEKSDNTSEHHQRRSSSLGKSHKCSLCQYATNRPSHLKRHMRIHSPEVETSFVCKICNFATKDPPSLKRHSRCHTGETPFKCDECPASFNTPASRGNHISKQHPVEEHQPQKTIIDPVTGAKKYKCEFCEYITNHSTGMKSHIRTHTGERPFVCKECNHAFKQRSDLTWHMRFHAGEKPFKCDECSASFNKPRSLAVHITRQHEERGPGELEPYLRKSGETKACRFCPKMFRCIHHRIIHERMHTGEKPFECKICTTRFTHKGALKSHKLTHAEEAKAKPLKCGFCNFACRSKQGLDTHVRNHTGEKPYKCNVCDTAFKQPIHLKQHLYVHHTNEKPYACKVCDYTCTQLGSLKVHKRKHTGEKPFKCDLCEYASTTSSGLKKHRLQVHTEAKDKPFKCKVCDYATGLSNVLKRHMRVHRA